MGKSESNRFDNGAIRSVCPDWGDDDAVHSDRIMMENQGAMS